MKYTLKARDILRKIRQGLYFGKITTFDDYLLIAHAGGAIDNIAYTNSLEAFIENYNKGFKVFEIDFILTSDQRVVARHDWVHDFGQREFNEEYPLSYNNFMSRKLDKKFTPMDFEMVINLMHKYNDISVIMDGKINSHQDTKYLYGVILNQLKNVDEFIIKRLMPQIFYQEDLQIIKDFHFGEVVYVIGREKISKSSIIKFCNMNDIKILSIPERKINIKIVQQLLKKDIYVYTYTINSKKHIESLRKIGVLGFFTDFVSPEALD